MGKGRRGEGGGGRRLGREKSKADGTESIGGRLSEEGDSDPYFLPRCLVSNHSEADCVESAILPCSLAQVGGEEGLRREHGANYGSGVYTARAPRTPLQFSSTDFASPSKVRP